VVGHLQEGLSNVESKYECAVDSDIIIECVAVERQNQEVYQLQDFTQTFSVFPRGVLC
jgi:3-hydroxyisobutyrate dehydrogenase-like beta-hydroxyacid dehydrogenase